MLSLSPSRTLVTPYCKRIRPGRRITRAAVPFFSPCVPSCVDPSGLGHAATIYSSVQGPPRVETSTIFFLQEKSQTQETLKGFLRRAQNEFRLRIKKIRSDNGTEFKNSQIEGFLEEEGIKHEFSSPYTPQQNGVVERKNRTLLDMARTMLDEYKSPDRFWAEAINTACYSINRLYLHRILKKTS
jgi:hypothetical protein